MKFTNMEAFNFALLTKMGWRILKYLDSLRACKLKKRQKFKMVQNSNQKFSRLLSESQRYVFKLEPGRGPKEMEIRSLLQIFDGTTECSAHELSFSARHVGQNRWERILSKHPDSVVPQRIRSPSTGQDQQGG